MVYDDVYFDSFKRIILPAINETLYMVSFASLFSLLIGAVVGITLYVTEKGNILENRVINQILGVIVNIGRSVPFVIIIIAVFPLSKFIVGTTIGSTASIVPLTIAAAPFAARVVEASLKELDWGVVEASISMGASEWQIIWGVMLPEAAPSIILGITLTIINIIGYSAMAGILGGGGLGDVAVRYGYERFRTDILIITVIIMIVMVQVIQLAGNFLSAMFNKK